MPKNNRLPIMAYAIAALVIVADQLSKFWVLNVVGLSQAGDKIEISRFFDLTMVWNRGVSFGLFRSPDGQETIRWILAAVSVAGSVAIVVGGG